METKNLNGRTLLAAIAPKVETVNVEGIGTLYIREMPAAQNARIFYGDVNARDMAEVQADVIIAAVVDAAGNPIYKDSDREAIKASSANALSRIFSACLKVNGMDAATQEAAEKN